MSNSVGRWRKCLGRFKMRVLTGCDAEVVSTRTTVGQLKGQFNGAMERYTWVRFAGKLTACQSRARAQQWVSYSVQGPVPTGDGTLHKGEHAPKHCWSSCLN